MTPIARILCPVDFSASSRRALGYAAALAGRHGARLGVLHIVGSRPGVGLPSLVPEEPVRGRLLAELKQMAVEAAPMIRFVCSVSEAADVPRAIVAAAARLRADLLVLGSHGRTGFRRLALGSVAESVVRHAPCPALVVPRRAPGAPVEPLRYRELLCAIDFSAASLRALAYARLLAGSADAHLTVLNVIDVPRKLHAHVHGTRQMDAGMLHAMSAAGAKAALRRLVANTPPGIHIDTEVRQGNAPRAIVRAAAERCADVIVMGVQGRGALDLLVHASNTARVTRAADCPVLIVPQWPAPLDVDQPQAAGTLTR